MELSHKTQKLLEKSKLLPEVPGCYLMKNKLEQVIYVGKAKNLKNRVQSYFNQSVKNAKTEILVQHIVDFEFIITKTDAESFVLENNLIKKFFPKYNIRLKDDKSYPYVVVNFNEPFPRLEFLRKVKREKNKEIFGPFVTGSQIGEILRILTKSFGLRDCSLSEFHKRKEPCLLFQMKQCTAPCVGKIEEKNYLDSVNLALDLFRSKGKKTIHFLEEKMHIASEALEFELAANVRDQLQVINQFVGKFVQENAEIDSVKNMDLVAFYQGEIEFDISIYMMRNGILLGHKNFSFSNFEIEDQVEDVIIQFLFQYYMESFDTIPEHVFTHLQPKYNQELEHALREKYNLIQVGPVLKKYDQLMSLTRDHAFETQRVRLLHDESVFVGLNKLKDLLNLKERPVILECFDIAIFQGKSPTASQIVFHNGIPDKKNYRHYHLTELPEGNNDFAMMKELIVRRSDNGNLPDIFIVDGGIGQVNVFREALKDLKIEIPVVGIAKSKTKKTKDGFQSEKISKTEERLIIPNRTNPYLLHQCRPLFKIIVQMRDEAHRFSRRLHHHQEKKRIFNKA